MTGEHSEICGACSSVVTSNWRIDFHALLEVILGSQHVMIPEVQDRAWKVIEGSGMGLLASGEISDVALCVLCEFGFVDSDLARSMGLELYLRYKDDVLIVLDSSDERRLELGKTYSEG